MHIWLWNDEPCFVTPRIRLKKYKERERERTFTPFVSYTNVQGNLHSISLCQLQMHIVRCSSHMFQAIFVWCPSSRRLAWGWDCVSGACSTCWVDGPVAGLYSRNYLWRSTVRALQTCRSCSKLWTFTSLWTCRFLAPIYFLWRTLIPFYAHSHTYKVWIT